jgi:hypothetical protein
MGGRSLQQAAGTLSSTPVQDALRQSLLDLGLAPAPLPMAA